MSTFYRSGNTAALTIKKSDASDTPIFAWVTHKVNSPGNQIYKKTKLVTLTDAPLALPLDSPFLVALFTIVNGVVTHKRSILYKYEKLRNKTDPSTKIARTEKILPYYSLTLTIPSFYNLVDDTDRATKAAIAYETTLMTALATKVSQLNESLVRPVCVEAIQLMHVTSLNVDMPEFGHLPIVNGITDINDGLANWTDKDIGIAFQQCLAAADYAANYQAPKSQDVLKAVTEMRFVAALRMFAGPKHQNAEKKDDRTLLTTKLYTTGDCDDAALLMCTFATRLKQCNTLTLTSDAAHVCNVAKAIKEAQYHQGTTCGKSKHPPCHAWASLVIEEDGVVRRLHCEGLRLMACHLGNLDTLYGKKTFSKRPAGDAHHVYLHGIEEIPENTYAYVCSTYTATAMTMLVCKNTIGVDFKTHMTGDTSTVVHYRVSSQKTPSIVQTLLDLRAAPSPQCIERAVRKFAKQLYGSLTKSTKFNIDTRAGSKTTDSTSYVFVSPGNAFFF